MAVNWFPKIKPGMKITPGNLGGYSSTDYFAPLANSQDLQGQYFNLHGAFYDPRGRGTNYGGMIGGSPDLSALKAAYAAQSQADAASRDAALRRLVISYGAMPSLDSMGISDAARGFLKSAINDKTMQLAQNAEKEGVSVHARQASQDAIARRQIPATLAGRGLLHSGQTGYDFGQQAQSYKNQQYDTLNELLGNVENTVGGFLQAERDRQLGLAQAQMQAAWAAMQSMDGSYGGPSGYTSGVGTTPSAPGGRGAPPRRGGYFGTAPGGRRTPYVVDPRTGLPRGI